MALSEAKGGWSLGVDESLDSPIGCNGRKAGLQGVFVCSVFSGTAGGTAMARRNELMPLMLGLRLGGTFVEVGLLSNEVLVGDLMGMLWELEEVDGSSKRKSPGTLFSLSENRFSGNSLSNNVTGVKKVCVLGVGPRCFVVFEVR